MTTIDISSEEYRAYTYPDGSRFQIMTPTTLWVMDGGSHRVLDQAGVTHRPERGWVGISWKARDGEQPFVA